jgi:hypothetical protein
MVNGESLLVGRIEQHGKGQALPMPDVILERLCYIVKREKELSTRWTRRGTKEKPP